MKLGTLMYHDQNKNYKFVKQPQAIKTCGPCAYNLLIVGPTKNENLVH